MTGSLIRSAPPTPPDSDPDAAGASLFVRLPLELRPNRALIHYYALSSLSLGPFFPLLLLPRVFRFRSMRYLVDREGITMRWGILFRREISLTYTRIQDIHLSSNFVERWLGLARIQVQTASGSATAEMTIEGIPEYEEMRDFLYSRMRGARDPARHEAGQGDPGEDGDSLEQLALTLRAVAEDVRAIRETLDPGVNSPHSS